MSSVAETLPSDPTSLYYEDLAVGRIFLSGTVEVTAEEITRFAARYDPQPFHLDPAAAAMSAFGGLVASGWLTAALTMRLMVTSEFRIGGGVIGLGVESVRWPAPVRPGDCLTAEVRVESMRDSESRPAFGVVKIHTTTRNQQREPVQLMVSHVLVRRRPSLPDPEGQRSTSDS